MTFYNTYLISEGSKIVIIGNSMYKGYTAIVNHVDFLKKRIFVTLEASGKTAFIPFDKYQLLNNR